MLFTADDGTSGQELWLSNGRATGTVRVKDLLPGASGSNPWGFTAIGKRRVLFSADGVDRNGAWAGREFYVTDGTSRGTVLAGAALPGPGGLSPYYFTSVGKTVFFVGSAKRKGEELFAIDLDGFSTRHGDGHVLVHFDPRAAHRLLHLHPSAAGLLGATLPRPRAEWWKH